MGRTKRGTRSTWTNISVPVVRKYRRTWRALANDLGIREGTLGRIVFEAFERLAADLRRQGRDDNLGALLRSGAFEFRLVPRDPHAVAPEAFERRDASTPAWVEAYNADVREDLDRRENDNAATGATRDGVAGTSIPQASDGSEAAARP
jgi:hypothetical protein